MKTCFALVFALAVLFASGAQEPTSDTLSFEESVWIADHEKLIEKYPLHLGLIQRMSPNALDWLRPRLREAPADVEGRRLDRLVNAMLFVGEHGESRDVGPLVGVVKTDRGSLSYDELKLIGAGLDALGRLARREVPEARQTLVSMAAPGYWGGPTFGGPGGWSDDFPPLPVYLACQALHGLACAADPGFSAVADKLLQQDDEQRRAKPLVDQATARHQEFVELARQAMAPLHDASRGMLLRMRRDLDRPYSIDAHWLTTQALAEYRKSVNALNDRDFRYLATHLADDGVPMVDVWHSDDLHIDRAMVRLKQPRLEVAWPRPPRSLAPWSPSGMTIVTTPSKYRMRAPSRSMVRATRWSTSFREEPAGSKSPSSSTTAQKSGNGSSRAMATAPRSPEMACFSS